MKVLQIIDKKTKKVLHEKDATGLPEGEIKGIQMRTYMRLDNSKQTVILTEKEDTISEDATT